MIGTKLETISDYVKVRSYVTLDARLAGSIGIYLPIDGVLSLVYSEISKDLRQDDRI